MFRGKIRKYLAERRDLNISKAAVEENMPLLSRFPVNLTDDEKREVDSMWGFFPAKAEWNYMYHSAFKAISGFDKNYVPSCCCYPYILRVLNRTKEYEILEHKGLTDLYLRDIPQPFTPLRKINGIFYDKDYNPLKGTEYLDLLLDINKSEELIVKQAKDSSCGLNIQFIPVGSDRSAVEKILDEFKTDLVVQTLIKQSPITAVLNPTSVNSFRISTLNLNGNITATSVTIKAGGKGNKVDNVGGGHGGMMIGVSPDCKVSAQGHSSVGESVQVPAMPEVNISEIKDFAVRCHHALPHIGMIGWDIALDENDNPIMIEANLHWPGITAEQVASGPFFGERTEEVLDYVKRNKFW